MFWVCRCFGLGEAGVSALQILLERGFDPNAAPFRHISYIIYIYIIYIVADIYLEHKKVSKMEKPILRKEQIPHT